MVVGSTENIKEGNEEIRQVGEIQTLMKHIKTNLLFMQSCHSFYKINSNYADMIKIMHRYQVCYNKR